jgi:AsmA-like protein
MQGDFGIADGRFTNQETQRKMEKLSEQARGQNQEEDPADVISELKGHLVLQDGRATFSNLSFSVPGAMVRMHGTYDLDDQRVNLQGILQMRAKLSNATTGVKSFLVKALDPFLHKPSPRSIPHKYYRDIPSPPSYHVLTRPKKS